MPWWIAAGAIIDSALYLTSVVTIGVVTHNEAAWKIGVAAIGVTYLSYFVQAIAPKWAIVTLSASIVLGLLAGLALLV